MCFANVKQISQDFHRDDLPFVVVAFKFFLKDILYFVLGFYVGP